MVLKESTGMQILNTFDLNAKETDTAKSSFNLSKRPGNND